MFLFEYLLKFKIFFITMLCLPCFLNWQSPWCLAIAFLGPLQSHPAPAYWQATRVPEHRYFKWSSKFPRCNSSEQESELGHVTICLSKSLIKNERVRYVTLMSLCIKTIFVLIIIKVFFTFLKLSWMADRPFHLMASDREGTSD